MPTVAWRPCLSRHECFDQPLRLHAKNRQRLFDCSGWRGLRPRHGDGEPPPVADDVGRGVGVEMRRAALGLATIDLFGVAVRLAVVGDPRQIDRHRIAAFPQGLGQVGGQARIEPPLQLVDRRQDCPQGIAHSLVRRRPGQTPAGVEDRGDPRGGVQQDRDDDRRGASVAVIRQPNVILDDRGGTVVDLPRTNAILSP